MHPAVAVPLLWSLLSLQAAIAQSTQPPIVIRSNQHVGSPIWGEDRAGAPAANGTVNLLSETGGTQSGVVNSTGANTQLNRSAVAQPASAVVQGAMWCPANTPTWTVGSDSCTGVLPETMAGAAAVTASDTTAPTTGSATYTCQANGTWSAPSAVTCSTSCAAGTLSWTVGAATCSAGIAAGVSGNIRSISDTTAPSTGSASYTCSAAGAWTLNSGVTCSSQPPLGSLGTDRFLWIVARSQGGDSPDMQIGSTSIAAAASTSISAGFDPFDLCFINRSLAASGSSVSVPWWSGGGCSNSGASWQSLVQDPLQGYLTYFGSECRSGTVNLRGVGNAQFPNTGATYPINGIICRKGFTP